MRLSPALSLCLLLAACEKEQAAVDAGTPAPADAGMGNPDAAAPDAESADAEPTDAGGLEPGVAPPRRGDMAYGIDPETTKVYMFYGDRAEPQMCGQAASDFMDDGWVFDPRTGRWADLPVNSAAKPTRRARPAGAWDAMRKRFIVFGGRFRAGTSGAYTFLKDLWAYDPASGEWTELSSQNEPSGPTGRMNATMVADPANDRILVHGGGTTNFTTYTIDNRTWAFSFADNTWSEIGLTSRPPARIFHTAAFDRQRRRLFVFAGAGEDALTSPTFFRDMYYLDLATDAWTQVVLDPASQPVPAGRIKATLDYDEGRDRLVLFAGHDDGQLGNDNDIWLFDLANLGWSLGVQGDTFNRLFPNEPFCDFPADFANVDLNSPERRESHLFVTTGDLAVMYGGRTDCGLANDTWVLDLRTLTWMQVTNSMNGMTCFRSGRTDCNEPTAKKCG